MTDTVTHTHTHLQDWTDQTFYISSCCAKLPSQTSPLMKLLPTYIKVTHCKFLPIKMSSHFNLITKQRYIILNQYVCWWLWWPGLLCWINYPSDEKFIKGTSYFPGKLSSHSKQCELFIRLFSTHAISMERHGRTERICGWLGTGEKDKEKLINWLSNQICSAIKAEGYRNKWCFMSLYC